MGIVFGVEWINGLIPAAQIMALFIFFYPYINNLFFKIESVEVGS